jgi:hypothetical protein
MISCNSSVRAFPWTDTMTFKLLNNIDISDGGATRRIALYEGDLTAIPPEHRADILVVSAFPHDYSPTPTSLIGALNRAGLSVAALAANKAHDLRATSAFWISQPLGASAPVKNIGQVACFEPAVRGSPPSVVGTCFAGCFHSSMTGGTTLWRCAYSRVGTRAGRLRSCCA